MKYIVECRAKGSDGNITTTVFRGFGSGLPDKQTARKVYRREIYSGTWDAVYMEKLYANGTLIDVATWYK